MTHDADVPAGSDRDPRSPASTARRDAYLQGLVGMLDRRSAIADERRADHFAPDTSSPEAYEASLTPYREELRELIGWPLRVADGNERPVARLLERSEIRPTSIEGDVSCLTFEVLDEVPMSGILARPRTGANPPLVLALHGGSGTSELICGLDADSANYNHMVERLVARGFAVFAPQMLRWHAELPPDHRRFGVHDRAERVGGSLPAIEFAALGQVMDWFGASADFDHPSWGVAGLSYGGFYALHLAALEPRIKCCVASCCLRGTHHPGLADMFWYAGLDRLAFAETAAMICPRRLYIEHGVEDDIFPPHESGTYAVAERIADWFGQTGVADRCVFHVHPGGHEMDPGDGWLDFMTDAML